MTTVIPKSESLKRALKWVSDSLNQDPARDTFSAVRDAVLRFDLSPKDEQFLYHFYRRQD